MEYKPVKSFGHFSISIYELEFYHCSNVRLSILIYSGKTGITMGFL